MLNRVEFIGNLGADPEIRRLTSGKPVANMRLAVTEKWKDQSGERKEKTEWISIVCFSEGLCNVIENYLHKGSKIYVSGSWQTRKWTDQAGNDRYSTECVLQGFDSKLLMLDSRSDDSGQRQTDRSGGDYAGQSGGHAANSRDLDDDIPFLPEWRV